MEQQPPPHSHLCFGGDTVATCLFPSQLAAGVPSSIPCSSKIKKNHSGFRISGGSSPWGWPEVANRQRQAEPWLCFPSSLQATENIIKQLHPARICQENEAGETKSGEGASKHEQAVPCQRQAGAAPGACREVAEPPAPSPPSPWAAPRPRQKGAWDLLGTEEKLWASWWMLH